MPLIHNANLQFPRFYCSIKAVLYPTQKLEPRSSVLTQCQLKDNRNFQFLSIVLEGHEHFDVFCIWSHNVSSATSILSKLHVKIAIYQISSSVTCQRFVFFKNKNTYCPEYFLHLRYPENIEAFANTVKIYFVFGSGSKGTFVT